MQTQEQAPEQDQIDSLEARRLSYLGMAGGWPPNVRDPAQLAQVRAALLQDMGVAKSFLARHPASLRGREVYADLLRMAHNLDVQGAAEQSDAILQQILAEHPDSYAATLSLASLYITANPNLVSKAEVYFKRALALRPDDPDPLIFQGLGFACLHQKKTGEAIEQFSAYLRLVPDDNRIAAFVAKLDAGAMPSAVHVPGVGAPVRRPSKPWWKLW